MEEVAIIPQKNMKTRNLNLRMKKSAKCLVSNTFLTPDNKKRYLHLKTHSLSPKIKRLRTPKTRAFDNISDCVMIPRKTHIAVLLRASCRFDSCWSRHSLYNNIIKPLYNLNFSHCLFGIICLHSELDKKQNLIWDLFWLFFLNLVRRRTIISSWTILRLFIFPRF